MNENSTGISRFARTSRTGAEKHDFRIPTMDRSMNEESVKDDLRVSYFGYFMHRFQLLFGSRERLFEFFVG